MILRNILMTVCFSAAWLVAAFSQIETAATGTASGPVCRLAAKCAASSFHLGAWFGGDDGLMHFLRTHEHLQDCVRFAAAPAAGHADPGVRFLAHVLFDYRAPGTSAL